MRILILCGGESAEHSVSLATAKSVMGAISDGHEVVLVGITPTGEHNYLGEHEIGDWELADSPVLEPNSKSIIWPMGGGELQFLAEGSPVSLGEIDVCIPLLHGDNGEDGTIQGLLELCHIPYVGNGVFASAAAMDKVFAKALFRQAGIAVADDWVLTETDFLSDPESSYRELVERVQLPVFVKPARSGSSVGVSLAKTTEELIAGVVAAFKVDDKILIEPKLEGRELECSVLESRDGEHRVSVAGEIIVTGRDFYDYEAKYLSGGSQLIIPAELNLDQLQEMQSLARKAFDALGCSGLARTDFFLTDHGFYLTEVNTMPGFTSVSMYPKLWEASGLSYSELIEELIQLAL